MEADPFGTRDAVHRPAVHVVGVVGEVVARVDVVVPGGEDVPVAGGGLGDEVGDRGGHLGPARDGQAAALAEVVLHVDDDQCPVHGWYSSVRWGPAEDVGKGA